MSNMSDDCAINGKGKKEEHLEETSSSPAKMIPRKTIVERLIDYLKPLAALKMPIEWGLKWLFKIALLVVPFFLFLKLMSFRFLGNLDYYFCETFFNSFNNIYIFLSEVLILMLFIVLFLIFYKLICKFWSEEE